MTISPLVKSSKPTVVENSSATNITVTVKKRNLTIKDFKFRDDLPTAQELTDSDDKSVEKEWSWRKSPAKKFRSDLQELVSGLQDWLTKGQ